MADIQRIRVITRTALGGFYARDVVVLVREHMYQLHQLYGGDPVETFFISLVEALRTEGVADDQLRKLCLFDMHCVKEDGTVELLTARPPKNALIYFGNMSVAATKSFELPHKLYCDDVTSPLALKTEDPQDLIVHYDNRTHILPFPMARSLKELFSFVTDHVGVNATSARLRTSDGLLMNWSGRREILHRHQLTIIDDPTVVVRF